MDYCDCDPRARCVGFMGVFVGWFGCDYIVLGVVVVGVYVFV